MQEWQEDADGEETAPSQPLATPTTALAGKSTKPVSFSMEAEVTGNMAEVEELVTARLAEQGFGILTRVRCVLWCLVNLGRGSVVIGNAYPLALMLSSLPSNVCISNTNITRLTCRRRSGTRLVKNLHPVLFWEPATRN